jgi:hypothetical protein
MGASTTTPTRAAYPDHVGSDDFVHDETTDGRRLKCLTILAAYTREGLTISGARSMTAVAARAVCRYRTALTLGVRGQTGITSVLTACCAMAALSAGCASLSARPIALLLTGERSTITNDPMAL